ncbi:hypothetical protein HDV63DRAFT_371225 [Trichoderma sp. SZMC 28014]
MAGKNQRGRLAGSIILASLKPMVLSSSLDTLPGTFYNLLPIFLSLSPVNGCGKTRSADPLTGDDDLHELTILAPY